MSKVPRTKITRLRETLIRGMHNYRTRNNLTYKELGKKLSYLIPGVTETQARHILEGRVPRDKALRKRLMEVFGLDIGVVEPPKDGEPINSWSNFVKLYDSDVSLLDINYALSEILVRLVDLFHRNELSPDLVYNQGRWTIVLELISGSTYIFKFELAPCLYGKMYLVEASNGWNHLWFGAGTRTHISTFTLHRESIENLIRYLIKKGHAH